jgi:hypothetical protein
MLVVDVLTFVYRMFKEAKQSLRTEYNILNHKYQKKIN